MLRNAVNIVWMLVEYMPSLIPRTKAIIAIVSCPDPQRMCERRTGVLSDLSQLPGLRA